MASIDAAHEILRTLIRKPKIELHPEMSTAPLNGVADNLLAKGLVGWDPESEVRGWRAPHASMDPSSRL